MPIQKYLGENQELDFTEGEVIELPKEQYEYLLQLKEQVEQTKEQRKVSQKKYFLAHKKEYYATQKKWRDKNKETLNNRRRELYASKSDADKKIMEEHDLLEELYFVNLNKENGAKVIQTDAVAV